MLFKKKPSISKQQALAAKPVQAVDAQIELNEDGGGKLKVTLKQRKWAGFLLRMPEGATKTFELDTLGMLVWEACDGKTSVQQIIRRLAKKYDLSLREAEVPTVKFLQMLAKKGLIGMSVQDKKGEGEQD